MPIFWLTRFMPGGGRSVDVVAAGSSWSIEIAAWWPCATAQMMFFGPERRVAAEEHAGRRRLHGRLVDHRHVPLVELDADVALDPGERVLLADREEHVVAREVTSRLAGRHELAPALVVALAATFSNIHAGQRAVLDA